MSMNRIELLRYMADNINIHDSNRKFLQLIVEELEMLHGRTASTERVMQAIRKAQQ